MLFSLRSSAGVHGVLVRPFLATGDKGVSEGSSFSSVEPPGSPYAPSDDVAVAATVLEPGAFRFLDPIGLLEGVSVFRRPVS